MLSPQEGSQLELCLCSNPSSRQTRLSSKLNCARLGVSALPKRSFHSLLTRGTGQGERFEVFRTRPPNIRKPSQTSLPTPDRTSPTPPTYPLSDLNLKPFIFFLVSFFLFFDNAILKALCLVIPLCEHVNDNLLQNVKYVKDHSLFWKNLHLSF